MAQTSRIPLEGSWQLAIIAASDQVVRFGFQKTGGEWAVMDSDVAPPEALKGHTSPPGFYATEFLSQGQALFFRGPTNGHAVYRQMLNASPFLDSRVYSGFQAVTTQPFTEANSKNGTQYAGAFYIPSLAAGAIADLTFEVGVLPVLLKDIKTQFNSELFSVQFFKSPTGVTGGSSVPIYNLNDAGAVAHTSVITAGVSVSSPGTPVGPKEYSIGTQGQGNRQESTSAVGTGTERVLEAGATYLFRAINEDVSNPSVVTSLATWYQGELSSEI